MSVRRIQVLDPTARNAGATCSPSPGAGSLAGLRLGIRTDKTWRSFDRFAAALQPIAREAWGVSDIEVVDFGSRGGAAAEEKGKVERLARRIDIAVVGLGT